MVGFQIFGYTLGVGTILGGILTVVKYVVGGWINEFKSAIIEPLSRIETQVCNHNSHDLPTLIEQGKRTNELLEQLKDGQLEMSGFLKGMSGKN